jgi:hypothetical protein
MKKKEIQPGGWATMSEDHTVDDKYISRGTPCKVVAVKESEATCLFRHIGVIEVTVPLSKLEKEEN